MRDKTTKDPKIKEFRVDNFISQDKSLGILIKSIKEILDISDEEMENKIREILSNLKKEESLNNNSVISIFTSDDSIKEKITERTKENIRKLFDGMDFFELYNIPENDRLRNYQLFINFFNQSFKKSIEKEIDYAGLEDYFDKIEYICLNDAKIFEISDDISNVLASNDCELDKLPFEEIFIDSKHKIYDRTYLGHFIFHTLFEDKNDEKCTTVLSLYSSYNKSEEQCLWMDLIYLGKNEEQDKYTKRVISFISSFTNFVNEPDVKLIEQIRSVSNERRRLERGRIALPSKNYSIVLHGELRRFVDEFNINHSSITYSHKFEVRGHYMHFRDKTKYRKLYALDDNSLKKSGYILVNGMIKKWKRPFFKGRGMLVKKNYEVKK